MGARRDFSAALKVDREEGEGGGGRVFVRGGAVTHEYIVERCLGGLNAFPIAARVQPAWYNCRTRDIRSSLDSSRRKSRSSEGITCFTFDTALSYHLMYDFGALMFSFFIAPKVNPRVFYVFFVEFFIRGPGKTKSFATQVLE